MAGILPGSVTSAVSEFLDRLHVTPCCAAITESGALESALASPVPAVFILRADGLDLEPVVERTHRAGKIVAVHLDLVDGIKPDRAAVDWLARAGVDAVISSHGQLMAAIRRSRMIAIHRLLLTRHGAVESGVAAVARSGADLVEVLPGVILPELPSLRRQLKVPLLAGGFIRDEAQARAVLAAGAVAVTTSTEAVWRASLA